MTFFITMTLAMKQLYKQSYISNDEGTSGGILVSKLD